MVSASAKYGFSHRNYGTSRSPGEKMDFEPLAVAVALAVLVWMGWWAFSAPAEAQSQTPAFQNATGNYQAPLSKIEQAQEAARTYYLSKYGSVEGVSFRATDYGCHVAVDVYRDGSLRYKWAILGDRSTGE